jgi:hypothetical protein
LAVDHIIDAIWPYRDATKVGALFVVLLSAWGDYIEMRNDRDGAANAT